MDIESITAEIETLLASGEKLDRGRIDGLLSAIAALPRSVARDQKARALLAIATINYLDGASDSRFKAVRAIAWASILAKESGDRHLLRRCLSVQGLVLSAIGNIADALTALHSAVDLASALADNFATAAAWANIGTVHIHAMAYGDALVAFDRALHLTASVPRDRRATIAVNALLGRAIALTVLQSYSDGMAAVAHAEAQYESPDNAEKRIAQSLVEAAHARLSLKMNKIHDAEAHARRAAQLAATDGYGIASITSQGVEALLDAYRGTYGTAIGKVVELLGKSRGLVPMEADVLRTAIEIFELAGQPDVALRYHSELARLATRLRAQAMRDIIEYRTWLSGVSMTDQRAKPPTAFDNLRVRFLYALLSHRRPAVGPSGAVN